MDGNFGFIHEKLEIKVLILYIMRRLPGPATFGELTELTMCDDGVRYFDFAECVAELVETEHLSCMDGYYSLTDKGARNGETTQNSLPYVVRVRAENAASALRVKWNRDSKVTAAHTASPEGGFQVSLSLSDGIGKIVEMELFMPNEQRALALEKGFRKNAEAVYSAVVGLILGEG